MPLTPEGHAALSAALLPLVGLQHSRLQEASRRAPFSDLIEVCIRLFPAQVGVNRDGQLAREDVRWGLLHLFETTGVPTAATAGVIAQTIADAIMASGGERVHLCPLDEADTLPRMRFGPCEVRTFTEAEFAQVIQHDRLRRRFPNLRLDIGAFTRFDWLVVHEPVTFGATLADRPGFFRLLDFRMDRDFGAIQPFARKWPVLVEKAVFALLLLPWEDMVQHPDINWCGFHIPWVYSVPADLLEAPSRPLGPETLTWEPDFYFEPALGEEVETEKPFRLPLNDDLEPYFAALTEDRWQSLLRAQDSPVFNPLVVHFLVRAFTAEGIDEFLGHITAIEAALGMPSDYGADRAKPRAKKGGPRGSECVKRRIAALAGNAGLADSYGQLFQLRSTFLHGRPMDDIPSAARVQARTLARQIVELLVQAAIATRTPDRNSFLAALCP